MKIKLCLILVVCVVFGVVQAGKFRGAASKVRGGSSWGSAGRDRSRPRPQTTHTHTTHTENKPKPQPNYDNTKLSYGQHETHSAPKQPSAPPAENPHKPSAPPAPNTQQHVTNQQSGAPNNQPIGWNVGNNQPNQPNQGNTHNIGFDNVNKQAGQGNLNQHNVPQTNNYNPNQGYHPNQPGYNPNQPGYNPNQQGYHPNQPNQGYNPNQQGYHPNQPNQGYHPNQGYNPNQGYHPNQGYNPQGGYNPHYGYNNNNGYGYQPPGSNVHYGPVTYINGQQTPAYSYSLGGGGGGGSGIGSTITSTLLGGFVGYQVARMFSHSNAPQFRENTYVIHHYHNDTPNAVPAKVAVEANTVITCAENITLLCIQHSFPVCMSNGTIMCASNQQYITPCKNNPSMNCIETKIDCTNNPACNTSDTTQNTTTLSVPCLSSVSIFGDLSILKNVINSTDFIPPPNVTVARDNNTVVISGNITNSTEASTEHPMTTVADASNVETTVTTTTTTTASSTTASQSPPTIINNVYCVTVMAVPTPINKTAVEALPHPLANPEVQEKGKPESQSQATASSSVAGLVGCASVNLLLSMQLVYLSLANTGRYF